MKVGILTFHWASNYGAVLQCYALQKYLESLGHDVSVINYKPRHQDRSVWKFFRYRQFRRFHDYLEEIKKDKALKPFRNQYLHLTKRAYYCSEIPLLSQNFDIVISGSDQVLNPSFLLHGDGMRTLTPSYYLGFPFKGKRVAYAVSFGTVNYPERATAIAANYLKSFQRIGVRETSGCEIVRTMGRKDAEIVPDPTILIDSSVYLDLANKTTYCTKPYIFCFFIRNVEARKEGLKPYICNKNTLWNNDDNDYSLNNWLSKIHNSNFVITDSFHCVVMSLKYHKPFVVVTEQKGNVGMNDRLFTLLSVAELTDRIVYKEDLGVIDSLISQKVCWQNVDVKLEKYRQVGVDFLSTI